MVGFSIIILNTFILAIIISLMFILAKFILLVVNSFAIIISFTLILGIINFCIIDFEIKYLFISYFNHINFIIG